MLLSGEDDVGMCLSDQPTVITDQYSAHGYQPLTSHPGSDQQPIRDEEIVPGGKLTNSVGPGVELCALTKLQGSL